MIFKICTKYPKYLDIYTGVADTTRGTHTLLQEQEKIEDNE